jgi:hypothetical protein
MSVENSADAATRNARCRFPACGSKTDTVTAGYKPDLVHGLSRFRVPKL